MNLCTNRQTTAKSQWHSERLSCNLDHVLYGKLNSTDDEKETNAFAKKYKDDLLVFINYISESEFSVVGSYPQSWNYIREGLHSLERHTNFALCFKTEATDSEDKPGTEEEVMVTPFRAFHTDLSGDFHP